MQTLKAYTDFSFSLLGDGDYHTPPVRVIVLTRYDGDKTVHGVVDGLRTDLHIKHVYENDRRRTDPRCVPISKRLLRNLESA
jgi:hypothetical protein